MIDRKLLKTNRWEDEEYLQARMTNACFNGGGGGDGGGDDEMDDWASEEDIGVSDQDVADVMGQIERDDTAREIEAQMAAQEAARQAAAAQAQENARIAHAQSVAQERAQAVANRNAAAAAAAARQDRENAAAAAAAQRDRESQMAAIDRQMADQAAARNVDTFSGVQDAVARQNVDTFGGMQDAIARQNVDTFSGINNLGARQDIAADDYMGGFLDPTRSPAVDDFSTIGTQIGGGGWTSQGALDQARIDAQATAAGLDPQNQEGYFDRFGRWVSGVLGMPKDVQYQIDTFKEINPDGTVTHADGRITDASGQTISGPTSDWDKPWYSNMPQWGGQGGGAPQRGEEGGGDTRGVDPADGRVKPITDFIVRPPGGGGGVVPPGGGGTWPPGGDNILPWPPGGGGGTWPPGGGGGYPPWPPGGGGMWPPGGGGGYPPTYGAGRRTGGGMPGYMANYPIHSQNLFNFTPARAMPGIDPSYQPWMQPAQGMDQNLWNYQAPNLLPWDMTNRVPWNFATTPTGQYGPMVATVGGEPAERGDR